MKRWCSLLRRPNSMKLMEISLNHKTSPTDQPTGLKETKLKESKIVAVSWSFVSRKRAPKTGLQCSLSRHLLLRLIDKFPQYNCAFVNQLKKINISVYYRGANADLEMQTLKKNLHYQSRRRRIKRKRTHRKKRRRRHRVIAAISTSPYYFQFLITNFQRVLLFFQW